MSELCEVEMADDEITSRSSIHFSNFSLPLQSKIDAQAMMRDKSDDPRLWKDEKNPSH